jgi:uncharacterized membrane protein YfcA
MSIYLFAPPLFLIISFVFSMLGMGGSQLFIPILYWMGMDFKTEAVPLGMLLNVINSSTAAVTYARKKLINYRVAIPFGVTMVLVAPVGTWINVQLPVKPLLVFFALFTTAAALLMLSGWKPKRGQMSRSGQIILGVVAGTVLGITAGLIGRGGGSFVVPLLYITGLDAQAAAATSALVVTGSGLSSFISHLATAAQPSWGIWIATAAAVFLGSQLGSHFMAAKLKPRKIKVIFGVVLLGVAALILVKDVILA